MDAALSADRLGSFFAWAPLILGVVIYAVAWVAKRNELGSTATPIGQTFVCAGCGRRGLREHMVPQAHSGAVSYYCSRCSGAH